MMIRYPIRQLQPEDVPVAQEIRRLAGWNQTDADWMRLLALEPNGCFLIECEGVPAGTATTTIFDDRLAWIGMVLVHPDYRRRGLATALIRRCLDYLLDERQVACVQLDATPAGEPVYANLGFQRQWELFRWKGGTHSGRPRPSHAAVHPIDPAQRALWSRIDRSAFGVDRGPLLQRLAVDSRRTMIVHGQPFHEAQGFGMLRDGAEASYLGPVVAADTETGRQLVNTLLRDDSGPAESSAGSVSGAGVAPRNRVYWDLPVDNQPAEQLASELGFTRQRPLVRMWTGRTPILDKPEWQWAIAGPEIG